MDYSFLAARLSFTFIYTCIFFSWQINSAAAAAAAAAAGEAVYHRISVMNVFFVFLM